MRGYPMRILGTLGLLRAPAHCRAANKCDELPASDETCHPDLSSGRRWERAGRAAVPRPPVPDGTEPERSKQALSTQPVTPLSPRTRVRTISPDAAHPLESLLGRSGA